MANAGVALETETLGDPLADLGYAMNAWAQPDDPWVDDSTAPSLARGFPTRQYMIDRYQEKTGRDLSLLPFYVAFNRFKTACIIHGVYARYLLGKKSTEGVDVDSLKERMIAAIDLAELEAGDLG